MADISQIFKNGTRNKAENYRPLSLISIVSKLVKFFVKESIYMKPEDLLLTKKYDFINE